MPERQQTIPATIGFIGTGIMGQSMAGHLMAAGHPLHVFTRTRTKADSLVARGATWQDSVADVARSSDIVITMLGLPQDVEEVYLGADGLVATARPGSLLIDMTTSSPLLSIRIAHRRRPRRRLPRCPRVRRRHRRPPGHSRDHGRGGPRCLRTGQTPLRSTGAFRDAAWRFRVRSTVQTGQPGRRGDRHGGLVRGPRPCPLRRIGPGGGSGRDLGRGGRQLGPHQPRTPGPRRRFCPWIHGAAPREGRANRPGSRTGCGARPARAGNGRPPLRTARAIRAWIGGDAGPPVRVRSGWWSNAAAAATLKAWRISSDRRRTFPPSSTILQRCRHPSINASILDSVASPSGPLQESFRCNRSR